MTDWQFGLVLASALGAGLIGGAFFAFSSFVMQALARLPAAQGIAAMQSINITVITPWFLGPLFGTGALSGVAGAMAVLRWQPPADAYLVLGAVLYVAGTIGVTMVCNVPLNDRLARLDPASVDDRKTWARDVTMWTRWNHVRTVASLLASVCFVLALTASAR